MKKILKEFLISIFFLLTIFFAILAVGIPAFLITGYFNIWFHVFLLVSFLAMNHLNRAWLKNHQRIGIGQIHISKIEKTLLFPGLPNSFPQGNIKFQRILVLNTIVSLILMSTIFSSGVMVIFQLLTVVIHFIVHLLLGISWTKG